MSLVASEEVIGIICRSLNSVDPRLIQHGERVAYLVLKMLDAAGVQDAKAIRDVCTVTLLHDIGAYKTEEIDRMVQFETREVWHHSIYGYLFLKVLSPLAELAPAVLYHHLEYSRLKELNAPHWEVAQLIHLADRVDTFLLNKSCPLPGALNSFRGKRFSGAVLALLSAAEAQNPALYPMLTDGSFRAELRARMSAVPFTDSEIDAYLRMGVSAIDFRSYHTVTHTITTVRISLALATRMGLSQEDCFKVRYGAMVHDLGKIAIPVEILEFPGKLSPEAMHIMKTHVTITEEILGDSMGREITQIAARHHEKLDGSGYPRGLTGDVLSPGERIVAVADIVSALSGARSYKSAFGKEQITAILREQRQKGLLCPITIDAMLDHYDAIMAEVSEGCAPVLENYRSIQQQYLDLDVACRALTGWQTGS